MAEADQRSRTFAMGRAQAAAKCRPSTNRLLAPAMVAEAARALSEAEVKQKEKDDAAFRDPTRGAERSNSAQRALADPPK